MDYFYKKEGLSSSCLYVALDPEIVFNSLAIQHQNLIFAIRVQRIGSNVNELWKEMQKDGLKKYPFLMRTHLLITFTCKCNLFCS